MNTLFDGNWCYVTTDVPKEKQLLEGFMNAAKSKKGYRVPRNIWALRELAKAFPDLLNNQNFLSEGKRLKDDMDTLLYVRQHNRINLLNPKLRQYQFQDVEYLKNLDWAGIFNEPRTGKTPTVISLLKEIGTKRNLIVAPASLIYNWAKEFETWWPEANVLVYKSNGNKVPPTYFADTNENSVVIVSKDTLKIQLKYFDEFTWKTCIVDEAHFLRNYKTAQSKAVYKIKAERRYALTGTPTVKHPSDIWGILHFLVPKLYTSYWQFADRYFNQSLDFMGHVQIGGPKKHREKELTEMIALASTQRKRKEVMPWLPDKQRSTFTLKLDGKQQKLYDDMVKFFCAQDTDSGIEVDTSSVITQLMRMRQLCLDPRLLGFDVPGVKTEALLEYLDSHREPIVLMSMFTSYLKLLQPEIEKLGLKVGFIHGEMSNEQKAESAALFQRGRIDVLLCNIISAGTGFTLDSSSTVIFTDKAWNPSENEQAEDRVCPTTELKNHKHEIITFECAQTADERINELLSQKKSLTDVINEGGAGALRRLIGNVTRS
jgi:SNF2 family DNA or RNA helicase